MGTINDLFLGGAAEKAAQYQQNAALQGLNLQKQGYQALQRDAAPVNNVRDLALARIGLVNQGGYMPEQTPGVQYQRDLANQQIAAGAAARGKYDSGQRYMAQQDAQAGLVSQDVGNQLSRLGQLAGFGVGQNLNYNSLIGGNRNLQGAAMQEYGTQGAAGTIGQSNALSGLFNTLGTGLGTWWGSR